MNKRLIYGGLAILGAVAIVFYYSRPRRNRDGFFSAEGTKVKRGNCAICQRENGDTYRTDKKIRTCNRGDVCVNKYAFAQSPDE
jgi:hypothetical protein